MTTTITISLRLMLAIVVTIWAIVGFLLWIPILVRATTVFSAMVVHATITGQKPDALRGHLESACGFYPEGFRIAFDVIHNPTDSYHQKMNIRFGRVFGECLWTLVFWIFLLTFFHPSLFAYPWTAVSSIVMFVVSEHAFYWAGALLFLLLIFFVGIAIGMNHRSN